MKVFYIRCSTIEQNEARQVQMAKDCGAEKIFKDKASGKTTNREEFKKMMEYVREGDVIMTESISRIARNTRDLLNIIDELKEKQVGFISLKESIDTNSAAGKFMLTVFAALAELERENILERQREGIAIAKKNGVYKGRKPLTLDEKKFKAACQEWQRGERTAVSIQREFKISRTTFYTKAKERGFDPKKDK